MEFEKMLLCVVSAAFFVQIAMAVDYPVGGTSGGWDTNTDLSTWAAGENFVSGDSLTFTYPSFHDVVEVTKADYDTCSGSNALASYTGGKTTIKLTKPGKRYFICTTPGHCAAGMKLEVDVASTSAATGTAPVASAPKSAAPSPVPELTPTTTESDLPVVSTPASSPMPVSGAVGSEKWTHIGLGLTLGLFLVLTI